MLTAPLHLILSQLSPSVPRVCTSSEAVVNGGGGERGRRRSEGISRPLSVILRQLNKKVPESVIRVRHQDGFPVQYIPWHIVNPILNLHVPEWSGEVRSITYSPDGKTVSVVYRVTLHGTDAECLEHIGHGDREISPPLLNFYGARTDF